MAQATAQARRAIGNGAIYFAIAAAAAILLVTTILVVAPVPAFTEAPANDAQVVSPAVLNSAREWERQRLQQSGAYVDPARESAREWERQRLQQSPTAR